MTLAFRKLPASGAPSETRAETAWREKMRSGASAVENWSTALRGPSAVGAWWLIFLTFFFLFYTILTSAERGASAVEILGSPC